VWTWVIYASGTHLARSPFGGWWITIHNAIKDVMYALVRKSEHVVWREWWYALTSRTSLRVDLYMTHEHQVFVANVVVTNLTQKMVFMNAITQPTNATSKLSPLLRSTNIKGFMKGIILF
jgi:hypothetical protein